MNRKGFLLDERNKAILGKICTILYALTIDDYIHGILPNQGVKKKLPRLRGSPVVVRSVSVSTADQVPDAFSAAQDIEGPGCFRAC